MRINVYRLRAWTKDKELDFEFDFEFKDGKYYQMKKLLKSEGYRVQELIAWS